MYLRIFLATTAICRIQAQSSPQELANTVLQRWTEDSATAFASQFPFREGQEIHSNAAKAKLERIKGLSSVILADQKTAALLLSGVPLTGNSGDDTITEWAFPQSMRRWPMGNDGGSPVRFRWMKRDR
jgi:hypothetical protein